MKNNVIYIDFVKKVKKSKTGFFSSLINRLKRLLSFNKFASNKDNVIVYKKNIS
ncbi:hypothetical protein K144316041_00610 [Clostridium tetani]|uniref:Endoplasmic reticulum resident protein 29 C-terminal domain-containing protein n=1 Tax=Clostridium tetani TaxID=1513 RepID=A0ABC8E9G9_CLOTA|nr:hypothetical protein [Clostridium tetani]BDR65833.1 hypothetical protein K144312032_00610 [Clostridium tetani]BDR71353.1 hypothetical protein K144316041_00610 [Clostridium tetani]BDR79816.1 hypothetical protein K234311028_00620 [Clostridium tetani]BDR88262.1 hypothetical protein N072000002_00630 [Clostridium tetani]